MAKPKTNFIIEEGLGPNLLRVWTPTMLLAPVKELIEAIEGVTSVYHSTTEGHLNVWLNPCYDKREVIAEIKVAIPDTR